MKGAVVAATLLAACYRPGLEDVCSVACAPDGSCPGDAECVAGRCRPRGGTCMPAGGDSSIESPDPDAFEAPDAEIDAPGTTLCTPTVPSSPISLGVGTDFTMDRPRHRAAILSYDTTAMVRVIAIKEAASNVDASWTGFVERIFPTMTYTNFETARMTPDGSSIYFHAEDSTGSNGYIMVSNRISASNWSQPVPMILKNESGATIIVGRSIYPGAPTELSPRRMPLWTNTTGFDEFEETSATTWQRRSTVSTTQLGVTYIAAPSFTSDGRRVVFIGSSSTLPNIAVWVATRASVISPWDMAIRLFDAGSGYAETAPFYTADCSRLFFTDGTTSSTYVAQ